MMRPIYYTQSASGEGPAIPVDWRNEYFTVTVGAVVSAGASLTYNVEFTCDPVNTNDPDYVTPTWQVFTDASAETDDVTFSIISPIRAIRLNVTSYTSGSVRLQVIHSG